MSLITTGARNYLDRLAWGSPTAGQLSSLPEDQLRALLLMAQSEGQSEVEKWVLDAMRNRGIYASRRVPLRFQSKMAPDDWLQKAIALILAGGIAAGMWGGVANLPTVDPSAPAPTTTTQPYETTTTMTAEQNQMIEDSKRDFRAAGLQYPSVEYEFTDSCDAHLRGSWNGTRVRVCSGEYSTLIHELGHAWEDQFMTDSARQAFADRLGHSSWDQGQQGNWNDKPAERVAEVIKWKVTGGGYNGVYQEFFDIITS